MKDKETRIANVGSLKVPITDVVRDVRGHEDEIMEIVENDFVEGRHSNFGGWIHLLPDAADVAELDNALSGQVRTSLHSAQGHMLRL